MSTSIPKPTALAVIPEGIPNELKALNRWVVWRWAWKEDEGKWTKPPFNVRTGRLAKSTDPTMWSSFSIVLAAYQQGPWDGIGVVLTNDDDISGVDLDHCINDGEIDPEVLSDVRALNSYTEVSPSGTGLRVICHAKKPSGKWRRGDFEIYDTGRYLTITGHRLDGATANIEYRQEQVEAFHAQRIVTTTNSTRTEPAAAGNGSSELTDSEVLELARNAKNGATFTALYNGSDELHDGDTSRADSALCKHLAFWTRCDPEQIDRLFRGSRRMRKKWNEKRGDTTYGAMTIDGAIAKTTEVYTPPPPVTVIGKNGQTAQTAEPAVGSAGSAEVLRSSAGFADSADGAQNRTSETSAGGSAGSAGFAGGVGSNAQPWGIPMPLNDVPVLPSFPADALPSWLGQWVKAEAVAAQVPVDLPAMLVLAALATAAAGVARIQARLGWEEPLNLFLLVAMPPGTRKSKVFADVARPLMDYQYDELERMKSIITEAITSRRVAEKAAERAETEASKASPGEATQKRAEAISAAAARDAIQIPDPPRLLASDATPEALKSLLARSPYGRISLLSPEGDCFNMMAGRYQPTGGPPLEVYLNGHAGDYIQVDRKGRPPEHVRRPALTIGLAVQPDVLQSIAIHPGFRGQGLLGRFLYSLPADNVGYRLIGAPPVPADVEHTYRTNLQALVRSLTQEAETAKLNGNEWIITLSPEAGEHLRAFEAKIEPRLRSLVGELADIRDWASKLVGATARIAGLLHLAEHLHDGWGKPVDVSTVQAAIRIAEYLIPHALATFGLMGANPGVEDARYILARIQTTSIPVITRREIFNLVARQRFGRVDQLDEPLRLLEVYGWIRPRWGDRHPRPRGGRPPSPSYELHPDILSEGGTPRTGPSEGSGDRVGDSNLTAEPAKPAEPPDVAQPRGITGYPPDTQNLRRTPEPIRKTPEPASQDAAGYEPNVAYQDIALTQPGQGRANSPPQESPQADRGTGEWQLLPRGVVEPCIDCSYLTMWLDPSGRPLHQPGGCPP